MTDESAVEAMPAAVIERRDDIDRLVAVTWQGAGAGHGIGQNCWLVAVDGSECSLRAVSMAARLTALDADTEVDVLFVQPWLVKEAAETDFARRGWAATAKARQLLDAAAVRWRVHVVMGEAAAQIIAMTKMPGTRGVVVGSHGMTVAQALLLGSVAYSVAHQVTVPVMIVR